MKFEFKKEPVTTENTCFDWKSVVTDESLAGNEGENKFLDVKACVYHLLDDGYYVNACVDVRKNNPYGDYIESVTSTFEVTEAAHIDLLLAVIADTIDRLKKYVVDKYGKFWVEYE